MRLFLTPTSGVDSCSVVSGAALVNAAGESEAVMGSEGPPPPVGSTPAPGATTGLEQGAPTFLVPGVRTGRVDTGCSWQLSVRPWLGSPGGGVQGFAAPAPSPAP